MEQVIAPMLHERAVAVMLELLRLLGLAHARGVEVLPAAEERILTCLLRMLCGSTKAQELLLGSDGDTSGLKVGVHESDDPCTASPWKTDPSF